MPSQPKPQTKPTAEMAAILARLDEQDEKIAGLSEANKILVSQNQALVESEARLKELTKTEIEIQEQQRSEVEEMIAAGAYEPDPDNHFWRYKHKALSGVETQFPQWIDFDCPFVEGQEIEVVAFLNKSLTSTYDLRRIDLQYVGPVKLRTEAAA